MLVLGAIAARRWWQLGGLPTGLDGGQWLALGRGIAGDGRSTEGAYPPLVPFLVHAGQALVGPMAAVRLAAIGSLLAVMLALFLVARDGLGPWLALSVAATVGLSSALAEATAFGGYPQLVAFACLLLSCRSLARYLAAGRRADLLAWGAALAGAALSHHVYFPLAAAVAVGVCALWAVDLPGRHVWARRAVPAAAVGLAGAVWFLPTLIAFRAAGYQPPLDTGGLGLVAAFRYGTREATTAWFCLIAAGVASLLLTRDRRHVPTWRVAAALTGVALPLFLATGEVRLLPPLLAGTALGMGLGARRLSDAARRRPWAVLPVAVVLALPLLLWPRADDAAAAYYGYYRVVDRSLLDAAAAIEGLVEPGNGRVVVRHDRRGWPVGWWFEGLTDASVVVGSDERWLGFPAEREAARLAGRFFDAPLSGADLAELAKESNVDLLVFRKWEWIGWQRWLEEADPSVAVVYDDDRFMVLEVKGRTRAGG